jgi:hypothetical protein
MVCAGTVSTKENRARRLGAPAIASVNRFGPSGPPGAPLGQGVKMRTSGSGKPLKLLA